LTEIIQVEIGRQLDFKETRLIGAFRRRLLKIIQKEEDVAHSEALTHIRNWSRANVLQDHADGDTNECTAGIVGHFIDVNSQRAYICMASKRSLKTLLLRRERQGNLSIQSDATYDTSYCGLLQAIAISTTDAKQTSHLSSLTMATDETSTAFAMAAYFTGRAACNFFPALSEGTENEFS